MLNIDEDYSLIQEGQWAEFKGSKFKIAHITSDKFQKELARLQMPHRKKIESGNLDPEISKSITCEAMSKALLLDWENVVNNKKEQVKYSKELAKKVLMNDPSLREFISEYALNLANFQQEEVTELGENSGNS